jgi:hypothetical protein
VIEMEDDPSGLSASPVTDSPSGGTSAPISPRMTVSPISNKQAGSPDGGDTFVPDEHATVKTIMTSATIRNERLMNQS